MPTKFALIGFIAGALLVATEGLSAQTAGGARGGERYVAGRLLVQPRAGLSTVEFDKILQAHGARRDAVIPRIGVHVVALPPQANAQAVAQALRRNRHVKFAEPDSAVPPALSPDDPQYPYEWHLPKIGAPSAWDTARGGGVTIAVLDSGVDTSHPDLQSRLVPGWNFYDNNDNVGDVFGHGTAVAGIAAAAGNNGAGIASVSYDARILPMRVTDAAGNGYLSLMASALVSAADRGARVACISFLGVSASDAVDSAAQYMRSKGGVVVVSGGNKPEPRSDPARASLTVVAGTDTVDGWASSSWGDYVDVAAPAISIWTTKSGGGYGAVAGTSAAGPVAAGVYALMMSARPDLSPATLDQILFSSAKDLGTPGFDPYFGHGRVDAAAAVAKALQAPAADGVPPGVAITAPIGGAATGVVAVDVAASDNVAVTRVELLVNGQVTATDAFAPYRFSLDTAAYGDATLAVQARAFDAAGNPGLSNTIALIVGGDTIAPTVSIVNPANGSTVSGSVTVSVTANDDQRVAKIELSIDGQQVALANASTLSYLWNSGKGKGRSSSIVARAEDAAGNATSASVSVRRR